MLYLSDIRATRLTGIETCTGTDTANLRISCISAFPTVCNRNHDLWLQDGLIRETTVKNGTRPGRVQLLEHVPDAFQTRLLSNGDASSNCGRVPFMDLDLDRVASAG